MRIHNIASSQIADTVGTRKSDITTPFASSVWLVSRPESLKVPYGARFASRRTAGDTGVNSKGVRDRSALSVHLHQLTGY